MESHSQAPLRMLAFWFVTTLFWWGFAFMPQEIVSAEWLEAARSACFGTLENGLPDTYGWMLLILGPASFLIGLVVTWKTELLMSLKLAMERRSTIAILSICLLALLIEGIWITDRVLAGIRIDRLDFRSGIINDLPKDYPRTQASAPNFSLIDQNGRSVELKQFQKEAKVVLLSFAFAHCQSVCPALVAQMKEATAALDPKHVALLLITLDPRRDTPSSLPSLAKRWNLPENAHLLSGSVKSVEDVLSLYKVPFKRDSTSGNIDHPALMYVMSAEGQIAYTFNNAPPKWIIEAAKRLGVSNGI